MCGYIVCVNWGFVCFVCVFVCGLILWDEWAVLSLNVGTQATSTLLWNYSYNSVRGFLVRSFSGLWTVET